jgi:hypothetical protein
MHAAVVRRTDREVELAEDVADMALPASSKLVAVRTQSLRLGV